MVKESWRQLATVSELPTYWKCGVRRTLCAYPRTRVVAAMSHAHHDCSGHDHGHGAEGASASHFLRRKACSCTHPPRPRAHVTAAVVSVERAEESASDAAPAAVNPVRVATSSEDAAAHLELPAAFGRAEAAYKRAVDGDGGAAGQRRAADALEALLACVARIRAEGALSSNEELRDMSTGAFARGCNSVRHPH